MKFHTKIETNLNRIHTDYLVVCLNEEISANTLTELLGEACGNTVNTLFEAGDFKGKLKQLLTLHTPNGMNTNRLLLVGLGKQALLSNKNWFELSALIGKQVLTSPAKSTHIVLPALEQPLQAATDLASQLHQQRYKYSATLGNPEKIKPAKLESVCALSSEQQQAAVTTGLARGDAQGQGLALARELGNLPANICTPKYLQTSAETIAATNEAFSIETLEEADMEALGMGSLLSVAAGSVEPAKLIVLKYTGAGEAAPIALVGKGVTFDTGGISLKPGAKMDEMKYDMCGAASVLGVMQSLSVLQPKVNVVAIVPATENMPAGNATKPGDVVTSMSGKTIEVLNTDAEGRLILCDALTYSAKFKPAAIVDIATLTGACVVALGHHRSAVYGNDDALVNRLFEAGEQSQDLTWRMPLDEAYSQQLKSPYADLGNIGGPGAGSVTAACFLAKFAEDYPWAHLDIAGAAWNTKGIKGASGRPVPLLLNYVLSQSA